MCDSTLQPVPSVVLRQTRSQNWAGFAGYEAFLLPVATIGMVPAALPAWARMWLIALAIYIACKWLTWRQARVLGAPAWKSLVYLFAWPGMDADAFLGDSRAVAARASEWLLATFNCALGVLLVASAGRFVAADQAYARGWLGMLGIVLALHFGVFHLLSCAWRSAGIDARPLMRWPVAARSLSDFWGQRWNTAFRDLSHRFLFRPAVIRWGATAALLIVFVVSGLIHELAISLPVDAGWGGPTFYFTCQGLGLLLERSRLGQRCGLGAGLRGRVFAAAMLLAPLPILFHYAFVVHIIDPLLVMIGSVL